MSSTLLEATRASHEEIERLERIIAKDLLNDPPTKKGRLYQGHRVRNIIEQISITTHNLIKIYEDKDNSMKDEIAALGSNINVFSAFYDRLKEIREYHRRHPAARFVDRTTGDEYEQLLKEEPVVEFSGEEAFGRYLDLHELYNDYINSKFGNRMEYSAYLDVFSQPERIPRKLKLTRQYREYMQKLLEYLVYFVERTEPLQDVERVFSKVICEFEDQWNNGLVEGWESGTHQDSIGNNIVPRDNAVIDLGYYSTVEELMEVGPEMLKKSLAALGLKTGGNIWQRAERLFHTKHTSLENLDKRHFAAQYAKYIALMEAKVERLCDMLHETIMRTKENVEKKHALTYDEIVQEHLEDDEVQLISSESDDVEDNGQKNNNPLKLPIGLDGNPIPYWLYKLHGLDQQFKCEICGNHSYRGRRAYERHFKESRHQHGMQCLGIPNTKCFNEITSIEEAKQLWKKIQEKICLKRWRPDVEEECEDQEGNVYNKKTYTDLKREGLI